MRFLTAACNKKVQSLRMYASQRCPNELKRLPRANNIALVPGPSVPNVREP